MGRFPQAAVFHCSPIQEGSVQPLPLLLLGHTKSHLSLLVQEGSLSIFCCCLVSKPEAKQDTTCGTRSHLVFYFWMCEGRSTVWFRVSVAHKMVPHWGMLLPEGRGPGKCLRMSAVEMKIWKDHKVQGKDDRKHRPSNGLGISSATSTEISQTPVEGVTD